MKAVQYVIWGAGYYGRHAIQAVGEENVEAFLDSDINKIGKLYCGKMVINFEQYINMYKNCILVLALKDSDECKKFLLRHGIYTYLEYKNIPSELFGNVGKENLKAYIQGLLCDNTAYFIKGWGLYGLIVYDWINSCGIKCRLMLDENLSEQMLSLLDMYDVDYTFGEYTALDLSHTVFLCSYVRRNDLAAVLKKHSNYCYIFDCMEKIDAYYSPMLDKFRNIHKGKRCFIVATGPSLLIDDLDILERNGEICFSMNIIHKAFDKTKWRPEYYAVSDIQYISENMDIIDSLNVSHKFVGDQYPEFWNFSHDARIIKYHFNASDCCYDFSPDASRGCYAGHTITYICMQIAVFMGFDEIYLLGVDCNYQKGSKNNYFIEEDEEDYMEHREDKMLMAYQSAREYADAHGIKIYNATRGGALEVFERVNFDELFN